MERLVKWQTSATPNNKFHREHCHLSFIPVISVSDLVLSLVYYPLFHTLAPLMSAVYSGSWSHVADVRVIACEGKKKKKRKEEDVGPNNVDTVTLRGRLHSPSDKSPDSYGGGRTGAALVMPNWSGLIFASGLQSVFQPSRLCLHEAQLSIKAGPRRGLVSTFGVENRYKRHRRLSRAEWSRRLEVNETEGNVSEVAVLSAVDSD